MKRILLATFAAAVLSAAAAPAAFAGDIGNDIRDIQRDKARLRNDYRFLQEERRELRGAEARENNALRHGNWWQFWRAERQERHEARDVRAAERQIAIDRAHLARDRADLRHDIYRY
jgi:hypothetical protein